MSINTCLLCGERYIEDETVAIQHICNGPATPIPAPSVPVVTDEVTAIALAAIGAERLHKLFHITGDDLRKVIYAAIAAVRPADAATVAVDSIVTNERNAAAKEILQLKSERDEARSFGAEASQRYNELLASRTVTCVYCGHQYQNGTPDAQDAALTAHIRCCEKHPMRAVEAERDALAKFKAFVHSRLDQFGVPSDPDPEHNKQHGCRIGGRLNWVFQQKVIDAEVLIEGVLVGVDFAEKDSTGLVIRGEMTRGVKFHERLRVTVVKP